MKIFFKIVMLLVFLFTTSCSESNAPTLELSTNTPLPTNTVVPTNTPISFSLSGNFAFIEEDKIHIYSVNGQKIQTIQTIGWAGKYQFFQHGEFVAYSALNKLAEDKYYYSYGLIINDVEKNQNNIIVNDNKRVLYFIWNEEKEKIVYITSDGLYLSNVNGNDKEQLIEFSEGMFENREPLSQTLFTDFLPSPDGRYLLIKQQLERNDSIFLIDLLFATIVDIPKNFNCVNKINWTNDGKYFLCGVQVFDIENLGKPTIYDFNSSEMKWTEGGNKSFVYKGNNPLRYINKIFMGDFFGNSQTLLYTSEQFLSWFNIAPDGMYTVFKESNPFPTIENVKERTTNTVILNTNSLKFTQLFTEKGIEVNDEVIWLKNSQYILFQHGSYEFVKIDASSYRQSPVKTDLYLISLNDLSGESNTPMLLHSGYQSYILHNDYDNYDSNEHVAFMALNSSDTEQSDRYSVFVFDMNDLSLKEIVKTKGNQSYSIQWIE